MPFDCTSEIIGTVSKWGNVMTGVELIIFGAGPVFGFVISLAAWLCEGRNSSDSHQPYNHDWI